VTEQHVWGSDPGFVGPRHELRERLMLRVFLAAQPGRRVLNVGAGQGSFTNLLAAAGFEVVIAEHGETALATLREHVRGEAAEADATALPFAAGSFDAVVLGEVLEHVADDALALREAARVLVPGGVLCISVPRNPAWFSASDEWAGHVRRYARGELEARVRLAGFRVERCTAWGFPVSALYHRTVYEWAIRRGKGREGGGGHSAALRVLRALLALDRLFVGVERGALGYLLAARKPG
jgi:SAM-dependent methyltransferase